MTAIGAVTSLSTTGINRLHAQTWTLSRRDEFNASTGTAPSSSTWNFFMAAIAALAAFVVIGNQQLQAQVYNTTWSDEFNGPYGS